MQTRKRSSSDDGDFNLTKPPRITKSARTTRGSMQKEKTAEQLMANPKNYIYDSKTNLTTIFTSPEAQKAIEELRPDLVEQHRKLIANTGLARRSIANFQRDGRSGFYDPEWLRQAREAFKRHKQGDFDGYLKWKLYQDWPELKDLNEAREKAEAEAKDKAAAQNQEQAPQECDMEQKHEGAQQRNPGEQSLTGSINHKNDDEANDEKDDQTTFGNSTMSTADLDSSSATTPPSSSATPENEQQHEGGASGFGSLVANGTPPQAKVEGVQDGPNLQDIPCAISPPPQAKVEDVQNGPNPQHLPRAISPPPPNTENPQETSTKIS